ncbi:MAG: hypothetical protein IKK85_10170 [Clostridia bacterium]|nr:hypothetical protein [Clostridia bacterium]
MAKIISIPLALIMLVVSLFFPSAAPEIDKDSWNTNYKYIWVHGLMGWGSYDFYYPLFPYWGMLNGDLMKSLNKAGYECYAASVAPTSSAWDRACELYAQLTGTVVDYGEAHSERCGHDRYGEDFSGRALIRQWDSTNKINLLGHSFGGATVRVFASLMAVGSEEEMKASPDDVSPFFKGGKADWIYSVTALAAPHNGTSAYGAMSQDIDSAAYDMYIDNALELNKNIYTHENTYYFSIACSATNKNADGTYSADTSLMEGMFQSSANEMGCYTGKTQGGYEIDETWLENDGLVNTVSALAPSSAPTKVFDASDIQAGVWNIMPVYRGDHMSLQGGMTKVNKDIFDYYVLHLDMINRL